MKAIHGGTTNGLITSTNYFLQQKDFISRPNQPIEYLHMILTIDEELKIDKTMKFENCRVFFGNDGLIKTSGKYIRFINCEIFIRKEKGFSIIASNNITIDVFNSVIIGLEHFSSSFKINLNFYDSFIFSQCNNDMTIKQLTLYHSHIVIGCDKKQHKLLDIFTQISYRRLSFNQVRIENRRYSNNALMMQIIRLKRKNIYYKIINYSGIINDEKSHMIEIKNFRHSNNVDKTVDKEHEKIVEQV